MKTQGMEVPRMKESLMLLRFKSIHHRVQVPASDESVMCTLDVYDLMTTWFGYVLLLFLGVSPTLDNVTGVQDMTAHCVFTCA
jgi:hypothetical protein